MEGIEGPTKKLTRTVGRSNMETLNKLSEH